MIRFREVLRCNGVDEDGSPPGMIIAFGSLNFVAVETEGATVKLEEKSNAISISDADPAMISRMMAGVAATMSAPGIDPLMQKSYTPGRHSSDVRYYQIKGARELSGTPAEVSLVARKATAQKLQVLVLKKLTVKVAIRNVQVYDSGGVLKFHSASQVDPQRVVDGMNSIWTPQTQIEFELVPSSAAVIDDRDAKVKALIAKGYGLKDLTYATFGAEIDPHKLAELFETYKVPGADLTMFLLGKLLSSTSRPTGTTNSEKAMCFVASTHFPSTFAHEAGHFLGAGFDGGTWKRFGHTYDPDPGNPKAEDHRMLMRDGGAGFRIPFRLVKQFRSFRDRQTRRP